MRKKGYHNTLEQLGIIAAQVMIDRGSEEQYAIGFGFDVAEMIRKRLGGKEIYIICRAERPNGKPKPLRIIATGTKLLAVERGIDPETAEEIGLAVKEGIIQRFRGVELYIPRGMDFLMSQRNEKIFNEFNGRNIDELSERYGVTTSWIYFVISSERAKRTLECQKND